MWQIPVILRKPRRCLFVVGDCNHRLCFSDLWSQGSKQIDPKYWTHCCDIWALVDEIYPFLTRKFKTLTVFWSESCLVSVLINQSSTYCSRVPFSRITFLANAFPKIMGAVLNTLWKRCPCILGSLQGVRVPPYKDKKILGVWMEGNTEKCIFEVPNREILSTPQHAGDKVCGFGIRGWTGMTASFTALSLAQTDDAVH